MIFQNSLALVQLDRSQLTAVYCNRRGVLIPNLKCSENTVKTCGKMAAGIELDELQQYEIWDDKVCNNMRNEKHDNMNTNDDVDNWTKQHINDCVALHIVHFHEQFH